MLSLFKKKPVKYVQITPPNLEQQREQWLGELSPIDAELFLYIESLMKDPNMEWELQSLWAHAPCLTPVDKKFKFSITRDEIKQRDGGHLKLMSIGFFYVRTEWVGLFNTILEKINRIKNEEYEKNINKAKNDILVQKNKEAI